MEAASYRLYSRSDQHIRMPQDLLLAVITDTFRWLSKRRTHLPLVGRYLADAVARIELIRG